MESCDTLLIAGSSFPYIEFYPKPGKARAVQIELDPKRVGLRYPVEVGLVGDSKVALQELLPMLRRKEDRSFLEKAQSGMRDWWKLMEQRGTRSDKPMKPQVLAWELGKQLATEAFVSSVSERIHTGRGGEGVGAGGPGAEKPEKAAGAGRELGKAAADDAIVSCDSGTITTWWAR